MDGLTLRDWVTLIYQRRFESAEVDPPRLGRGDYVVVVRAALQEHDIDPLSPRVSKIVEAEKFVPQCARVPRRCGACDGVNLYVPPNIPSELARLLLHHERAHGWIYRRRDDEATEADVWFLTGVFAWPPWLRDRPPCPLPRWFLDLLGAP